MTRHVHELGVWVGRYPEPDPVFYCFDDECNFEMGPTAATALLQKVAGLEAEIGRLRFALGYLVQTGEVSDELVAAALAQEDAS